jgi:MGT family glycosyltransferase
MGTILNGRVDVFRTIVAALTKHRDLQLVLSVGDQIDPEPIGPVPNNAIIVRWAPQVELLKRASVCISHAGLNTVLESLTQGVPQVAIPVTFDQPGVAARIADKQTGVVTSLDKLTADHLSTLLDEVLTDPSYRDNAHKLQKAIAEANGLSVAADLVEESLGVRASIARRVKVGRLQRQLPHKARLRKQLRYRLRLMSNVKIRPLWFSSLEHCFWGGRTGCTP